MSQKNETDTNSSGPIYLDSDQLQELDKLISSLRKEVIVPAKRTGKKTAASSRARQQ